MVRLFVGVMIPEGIKSNILALQKDLKSLPMYAKFVEPENLHISILFSGEVDEMEIPEMIRNLDSACENIENFDVKLDGILLIPSSGVVRVIAVALCSWRIGKSSRS